MDDAPGRAVQLQGRFWQLEEARNFPVLVQKPRPQIAIGGTGPRRTPLMAASAADEFNSGGGAGTAERFANVRRVCEEIGRDPSTLSMSVTTQVICGSTQAEAEARLERLGDPGRRMLSQRDGRRRPDRGRCSPRAEGGRRRVAYLHIFDMDDLDHLRLIGAEVLPQVA